MRLIALLFGLWVSLFVFASTADAAQDYRWKVNSPSGAREDTYTHPTPQDACNVVKAYYADSNWIETVTAVAGSNPDYQSCYAEGNGQSGNVGQIHRKMVEVQPVCDAPNYINESGECVAPESICYTQLETMADECVFIGPDDPNDELPSGCVINDSGKQICLTEEPGCYTVNGFNYCPNPAEVCGMKNGAFSCVNPEAEGCGYFNGEKVCFSPSGDKVENTSPDHPDNGGNLDGNPENDLMDNRDETEGGDPNNQVDGGPIEPTTDADRATEKTSREQLQELKKLNKTLEQIGSGSGPTGSEASDKIDAAKNGLIAETGIDGVIDGIGSNPFGSGDLGGVPGIADGLIPQGTCVAYSKDVLGFGTFEITCDDTALLRTILAWVLYVLTAIYLFQLLTTPIGSKD